MYKVVCLTTDKANADRKANIERTRNLINLEGYDFIVQTDVWGIGTANHIHALNVEEQYDGLIVLEDDAYLAEDFNKLFHFAIEYEAYKVNVANDLVSLFTPKTRPQDWQQAIRKKIDNFDYNFSFAHLDFFTLPKLVTGVGYYVPADIARKMFQHAIFTKLIDANGLPHKNLSKNADFTIGNLYKAVTGEDIKYCYPSIVEHLNKGQQSDVWLSDEHTKIDRSAWLFWDDVWTAYEEN